MPAVVGAPIVASLKNERNGFRTAVEKILRKASVIDLRLYFPYRRKDSLWEGLLGEVHLANFGFGRLGLAAQNFTLTVTGEGGEGGGASIDFGKKWIGAPRAM